jgi:hypothetical protein
LLASLSELLVQVLPLPDPQVVEELGSAHPTKGTAGQRFLLLLHVAPEVEVCGEVGVLVGEALVRRVGQLLLVEGSFPRVLDAHRRHDDQDLAEAAQPVRFQQHPTEPGIDGQLREPPPVCGEPPPTVRVGAGLDRLQLLQQPDAVGDLPRVGRVQEREAGNIAKAEAVHLEDDRRQVGAQDLRVGELGPPQVVLLRIQADADPVGEPAAPAGALVRAGLADRLDRQPLDLGPLAVPRDPGRAGVDHVSDARDGQRSFGNVGSQDDPAAFVAGEHPVLLGGREPAEQGQHVRGWQVQRGERLGGVADLTLPRQEHQNVLAAAVA